MEETLINALALEWKLGAAPGLSKQQILDALAARISDMLASNSEAFFQAMYRLDINEHKLAVADVPAAVAALVWERQLQKVSSRACPTPPPDPDDALRW
jgi:hypothetical protein